MFYNEEDRGSGAKLMKNNNAYLKFYYGAMGCGKTRKLQGDYHSKKEDGFDVIVVKPIIDTKGDNKTLARDGGTVEATFLIGKEDNIYFDISKYLLQHTLDFILVDEAQFLESSQVDQLTEIVDILGITVICYGLRTDFQSKLFEGSKRLFEVCDGAEGIDRQCSCGNGKINNMRLYNGIPVFEGEQVAIDGIEASYEAVCRRCYKNARKRLKVYDASQFILDEFKDEC